jgi:hypothetical protein
MVKDKLPLRAMADSLNHASVPTARGGEWSAVQISRVIERLAI